MKVVLQRVSQAKVKVNKKIVGEIRLGLLLLVGVGEKDKENIAAIADKILKLRIFSDQNDKMNLSVLDIRGEILAVPQFTLLADIKQGNRPFFGTAAPPEIAAPIFDQLITELKKSNLKVESGVFGAKMEIELVNDGPVTIILDN